MSEVFSQMEIRVGMDLKKSSAWDMTRTRREKIRRRAQDVCESNSTGTKGGHRLRVAVIVGHAKSTPDFLLIPFSVPLSIVKQSIPNLSTIARSITWPSSHFTSEATFSLSRTDQTRQISARA
jgi:hypothetical protein